MKSLGIQDGSSVGSLIRFGRGTLAVLAVLFVLASVYVGARLNQSSMGMWRGMYHADADAGWHRGVPKAIRSDEWNTLTPWILNQAERGLGKQNTNIGQGAATLLTGVPVTGPLMVVQPKFWGMLVLPVEYGFSWSWAWKTFALFGAVFLLLQALTNSDTPVSLVGAAWVYGSSFTQWWFSNGLPEIICGACVATLGALYLLRAQSVRGMLAGAVLASFATANLLLYLYPPFQFPLLCLALVLVAGMSIERGGWRLATTRRLPRVFCLAAAALAVVGFAGYFLHEALPTMERVLDTVYPGRRVSFGGDLSWVRMFDGFFEGFRTNQAIYPLPPNTNASEASNYVLLFPLALMLFRPRDILRKEHALLVALAAYGLFLVAWAALPLPQVVRHWIAATGWYLVPGTRAVLGLGMVSIIGCAVLLARVRDGRLQPSRFAVPLIAVALGIVLVYALWLRTLDPAFFISRRIALGLLGSGLLLLAVACGNSGLAILGILVFIVSPLRANPLESGLAPLLDKPVLVDAARASGQGDRWMVVGDFIFSQGLKAKGLDVVTGSEYLPDDQTIAALDPAHAQAQVWNRYAHIVVASSPGLAHPVLSLRQADLYIAQLDVCGRVPRDWGVTRVAFTGQPPAEDLACLEPLPSDPQANVRLFRLVPR